MNQRPGKGGINLEFTAEQYHLLAIAIYRDAAKYYSDHPKIRIIKNEKEVTKYDGKQPRG